MTTKQEEPVFGVYWRAGKDVVALDIADNENAEPTIIANELLNALEARGVPLTEVHGALYRSLAATRGMRLAVERERRQEAEALAARQRELLAAFIDPAEALR